MPYVPEVEAEGAAPVFARIAHAIAGDIRAGRLRPGATLPGSRPLAQALGVHRNTALAAYRELTAQGWIEAASARATMVARTLPTGLLDGARPGVAREIGFSLVVPPPVEPTPTAAALSLAAATPDLRLAPLAAWGRALRRAIVQHGRTALQYQAPEGHPRLRAALATMLSQTRGIGADADDLVVTRGSQMAIDLVARALVRPGDVVGVEALGYPPAWAALRAHGARLWPIPIDEEGIVVSALAQRIERGPVRAIYLTPHHQFPTTVTLSAARRLALLDLARRHRVAILEDDYDHEFHYEGRPVLPLASMDRAGVVIYIGSLSKVLAPGLRLGYVVAPPSLLQAVARHRVLVDRNGDTVLELAIAELLEDDEIGRHVRRVRRIYEARRDALASALTRRLDDVLAFTRPAGGLAIWARARGRVDLERWERAAARVGVAVRCGRHFAFAPRAALGLRLGFSAADETEIARAIDRLARVRPR